MTIDLFGHFYFKKTVNGNLYGEYSHNKMKDVCTESCVLITPFLQPFEGTYQSAWLDDDNPRMAELSISATDQHNHRHFKLQWKTDNKVAYEGEGTLCGDILIGHYWKD